MNKKLMTGGISILIAGLLAIGVMAENSIVGSMDFQGEAAQMTLDQAMGKALKDNVAVYKAQVDKDQATSDAEKNKLSARSERKKISGLPETTGTYILNVTIPEFSADYGLQNADRAYEAAVVSLKADIEQSFFSLINSQKQLDIYKENLQLAKDLYSVTEKKYSLGLVAKQELLSAEKSVLSAENSLSSAENSLFNAKMTMNNKLGNNVMTAITLKDELKYSNYKLPDIATSVSSAFENRKSIKVAIYNADLQAMKADATLKSKSEISFEYTAEKNKLDQTQKDLETAYRTVEMEVRNNYLDVQQKQREITAGQKSVELAQESLRIAQASYDLGMSVMTDVQKAQNGVLDAKLAYEKAVLDYNVSVRKFEDSLGVGRS